MCRTIFCIVDRKKQNALELYLTFMCNDFGGHASIFKGREAIYLHLRKLRESYKPKKISQRKLAQLTGISARKISEWELHIAKPDPKEEDILIRFFALENRDQLYSQRR